MSSSSRQGAIRVAVAADLGLLVRWSEEFQAEAKGIDHVDLTALVASRIARRELVVWEAGGRPVAFAGVSAPIGGMSRVGPVYTPPAERGRGLASNAVAEVSARVQAQGARVCLYTDQANPTSNKVYAALGYRPVVDMANMRIAIDA